MGRFVPTGLHLTAGEAVYKSLLRRQNAWLDSMLVVIIERIAYDAMFVPIYVGNERVNLHTAMLGESFYNFQQLEAAAT
eukprot:3984377-Ditylum_brightwellii.AAC.1